MQSPIDFGKQFIEEFYHNKDVSKCMTYLADDIVWITPDEICHLKTTEEIADFLKKSIEMDKRRFSVDIASIKSAPTTDKVGTIVYEVNLIPQHTEESMDLRCSLSVMKVGSGYRLNFIGMSRRYQRTDTEQMRGFIESLPGGVFVLAYFANDARVLYSNKYFARKLGYEETLFCDKTDENPFFMMPYDQQKELKEVLSKMSRETNPAPASVKLLLDTSDNRTVPYQLSISAAYKDGSRTIFYMLFNDQGDFEKLDEKEIRKRIKKAVTEQKNADVEFLHKMTAKAQKAVDASKVQKDKALAEAEKLRRELKELREEDDRKEADLKESSDEAYARLKESTDKTYAELKESLEGTIAKLKESSDKALSDEKDKNESLLKEKQDAFKDRELELLATISRNENEYSTLMDQKKLSDADYEKKIAELEKRLEGFENEKKQAAADAAAQTEAVYEKKLQELRGRFSDEKKQLEKRMKEERIQSEANDKNLIARIDQLNEKIRNQQIGMGRLERDRQILIREQKKSSLRADALLGGQTRKASSMLRLAFNEDFPEKQREKVEKAAGIIDALPRMIRDLEDIGLIDPAQTEVGEETDFSISECMETVQKVIWPECREKGLIFALEIKEYVQDNVHADKAGLMLALLAILENAVINTTSGGRIITSVISDPPVRGKAYYHFIITDTGIGIDKEKLPTLFDIQKGELAVARKVVSRMGGGIQVTANKNGGSCFEVRVNLAVR